MINILLKSRRSERAENTDDTFVPTYFRINAAQHREIAYVQDSSHAGASLSGFPWFSDHFQDRINNPNICREWATSHTASTDWSRRVSSEFQALMQLIVLLRVPFYEKICSTSRHCLGEIFFFRPWVGGFASRVPR